MSQPLLSLRGISKSYSRGRHELRVLSDISLDVHPGEIAVVLGMRSQGKTTLLKIAAGLESPDRGLVRFDGSDLTGLSDAGLSRLMGEQIGWIGRVGPASGTQMLDYVALPLLIGRRDRQAYERARQALRTVGISPCAGQHWGSLSDSERALASIAHAIVRDPKLLVVDDLTANLGIRETDEVTRLLRHLAQDAGMAILVAVSDGSAALRSDRLMTLAGGRLTHAPAPPGPGANVIDFPGARQAQAESESGTGE